MAKKMPKTGLDGCDRDRVDGIRRTHGVNRRLDAQRSRMAAILAKLDCIPDRADAFDPLIWDPHGLPT